MSALSHSKGGTEAGLLQYLKNNMVHYDKKIRQQGPMIQTWIILPLKSYFFSVEISRERRVVYDTFVSVFLKQKT